MVYLEKNEVNRKRSEGLLLAIGRVPISAKFLEPKVDILSWLQEGSSSPPIMGRI
ncbi:TPA: hypothetical protein HA243_01195 [Candidatus Micrarchaeota archaeon]|nr:hypothetical protein [Candidatus Micrarchaeota archaeon]